MSQPFRLAVVNSHPIQYFAPALCVLEPRPEAAGHRALLQRLQPARRRRSRLRAVGHVGCRSFGRLPLRLPGQRREAARAGGVLVADLSRGVVGDSQRTLRRRAAARLQLRGKHACVAGGKDQGVCRSSCAPRRICASSARNGGAGRGTRSSPRPTVSSMASWQSGKATATTIASSAFQATRSSTCRTRWTTRASWAASTLTPAQRSGRQEAIRIAARGAGRALRVEVHPAQASGHPRPRHGKPA